MGCFSKCSVPACSSRRRRVAERTGAGIITRGTLVADDVVELKHVAPETLEGYCPPLIRDFLEVAAWGFSISASCRRDGRQAAEESQAHRRAGASAGNRRSRLNRLDMVASTEHPRVCIPVRIPVAAARQPAVLVFEVACANHILKTRGINPLDQFIKAPAGGHPTEQLMQIVLFPDCRARAKASPSPCWKTSAYYCVDNLPLAMLQPLGRLSEGRGTTHRHRHRAPSSASFAQLPKIPKRCATGADCG